MRFARDISRDLGRLAGLCIMDVSQGFPFLNGLVRVILSLLE